MALLIDRLRPFDVEVVDRAVFLYSRTPFSMTAPATYHRAVAVAQAIGRPTVRLAGRWRDDTTQDGWLSTRARRLRVRPTVGAVHGVLWLVASIIRWAFFPS